MKDLTKLKPNELIRLAITDMKTTIAQGHTIDMRTWGKNLDAPTCSVCFAGSIMLQQGKTPTKFNVFEPDGDINKNIYVALDRIRQGRIGEFCYQLEIENPSIKKLGFPISRLDIGYEQGKEEEFYGYMEGIAKLFD